jgi:hypothetical protein
VTDHTLETSIVADGAELDPTNGTYGSFSDAYQFSNEHLFDNTLPNYLITMQRSRRSRGHFCFSRFGHRRDDEVLDEIALNPRSFINRSDREIISTLVHEMCHQWQFHYGKPSRRGYHNKQSAAKMLEVGLIPSHTGEPGGKMTGQSVSHYIQINGAFTYKWDALKASGFKLDYQDREVLRPEQPRRNKAVYIWPCCSVHAWAEPQKHFICGECKERML